MGLQGGVTVLLSPESCQQHPAIDLWSSGLRRTAGLQVLLFVAAVAAVAAGVAAQQDEEVHHAPVLALRITRSEAAQRQGTD